MLLSELQNGKAVSIQIDTPMFDAECEVLVAGLGVSGAIAAIAAAEAGAKVIGVERLKMCGGSATAGGVSRYYFGLPGGRFEQIDQVAIELSREHFVDGNNKRHPYAKSHVLEQAILASGGNIFYESTVAGIYLEGIDIRGVKVITRGQVKNIACKVLIDSSGDGEVSAAAGANFELGRQLDGKPQPFSSLRTFVSDKQTLGLASFDAGYIIPDKADSMTHGLLQANALHREGLEDYGDNLLWLTLLPGIREGRLIRGDITLSFKDFIAGKRYANPVAYAYSNFDSHTQDWAFESDEIKDFIVGASLWGHNYIFPLPAEIMFVKGLNNLLCSSRCLSIDHDMASAIRMQRGLQKLGEAAGIIAALAVRDSIAIRDVDRSKLLEKLQASGTLQIPEQLPCDEFNFNLEAIQEILASDAPGKAIWQCGRNIDSYRKILLRNIQSKDRNIARNSAFALGLGGDKTAIPMLLDIVRERDPFEPSSSRSHNQRRLLGAIHLLGRFNDSEIVSILLDFIKLPELDIQEFSHALMTLLKLTEVMKDKKQIVENLKQLLKKDYPQHKLLLKISSNSNCKTHIDMNQFMRDVLMRKLKEWKLD
jgi:FAD dependent oxidoreductase